MQHPDLKLEACSKPFEAYGLASGLNDPTLDTVAKAYDRNIRRVYMLILFPPVAVTIGMAGASAVAKAEVESSEDLDRIKKQARKKLKRYAKDREMLLNSDASDQVRASEHALALSMLTTAAAGGARDGAIAWMAAQITGIWTAFEAMAEDLWVAALNTHPKTLAQLSGKYKKQRGNTPGRKGDNEEKAVRLSSLQRYGYDVSRQMGSILKTRYGFDSLHGIREAYAEAFSDPPDTIETILSDEALDAISAVRNNLVHSGGIIDEEYQGHFSVLPKEAHGDLNSEIPLDGELVAKLVDPVIQDSKKLISAVESWMTIN